jgi:hypothetical protein
MVNERIAKNIKKFILSFYKEVDIVEVKIQLYTQDIPTITVYFRQDEPYKNANQVLCENIRRNIKDFLNYTVVGYILLSWEQRLPENKNPVARIQCISINVDSF